MKTKFLSLFIASAFALSLLVGCGNVSNETPNSTSPSKSENSKQVIDSKAPPEETTKINKDDLTKASKEEAPAKEDRKELFEGYTLIQVDGGDLSGSRQANVVVDIGFGEREYYAFTNEYGQLVKVIAKEIILQDDLKEPVNSNGRYYPDEAKVPGVERTDLDEGHVIGDSLGGVSNAYNITPQNSTLNRYGDQAYMEDAIRKAGGCTDFVAIITYPDTTTQIPIHYSYTYTLNGNIINDEFDNINPDKLNSSGTENKDTPATNTNSSAIVYWTPNGKSYHSKKNCTTLSRSKTILEGTISESGKTDPCDKCN